MDVAHLATGDEILTIHGKRRQLTSPPSQCTLSVAVEVPDYLSQTTSLLYSVPLGQPFSSRPLEAPTARLPLSQSDACLNSIERYYVSGVNSSPMLSPHPQTLPQQRVYQALALGGNLINPTSTQATNPANPSPETGANQTDAPPRGRKNMTARAQQIQQLEHSSRAQLKQTQVAMAVSTIASQILHPGIQYRFKGKYSSSLSLITHISHLFGLQTGGSRASSSSQLHLAHDDKSIDFALLSQGVNQQRSVVHAAIGSTAPTSLYNSLSFQTVNHALLTVHDVLCEQIYQQEAQQYNRLKQECDQEIDAEYHRHQHERSQKRFYSALADEYDRAGGDTALTGSGDSTINQLSHAQREHASITRVKAKLFAQEQSAAYRVIPLSTAMHRIYTLLRQRTQLISTQSTPTPTLTVTKQSEKSSAAALSSKKSKKPPTKGETISSSDIPDTSLQTPIPTDVNQVDSIISVVYAASISTHQDHITGFYTRIGRDLLWSPLYGRTTTRVSPTPPRAMPVSSSQITQRIGIDESQRKTPVSARSITISKAFRRWVSNHQLVYSLRQWAEDRNRMQKAISDAQQSPPPQTENEERPATSITTKTKTSRAKTTRTATATKTGRKGKVSLDDTTSQEADPQQDAVAPTKRRASRAKSTKEDEVLPSATSETAQENKKSANKRSRPTSFDEPEPQEIPVSLAYHEPSHEDNHPQHDTVSDHLPLHTEIESGSNLTTAPPVLSKKLRATRLSSNPASDLDTVHLVSLSTNKTQDMTPQMSDRSTTEPIPDPVPDAVMPVQPTSSHHHEGDEKSVEPGHDGAIQAPSHDHTTTTTASIDQSHHVPDGSSQSTSTPPHINTHHRDEAGTVQQLSDSPKEEDVHLRSDDGSHVNHDTEAADAGDSVHVPTPSYEGDHEDEDGHEDENQDEDDMDLFGDDYYPFQNSENDSTHHRSHHHWDSHHHTHHTSPDFSSIPLPPKGFQHPEEFMAVIHHADHISDDDNDNGSSEHDDDSSSSDSHTNSLFESDVDDLYSADDLSDNPLSSSFHSSALDDAMDAALGMASSYAISRDNPAAFQHTKTPIAATADDDDSDDVDLHSSNKCDTHTEDYDSMQMSDGDANTPVSAVDLRANSGSEHLLETVGPKSDLSVHSTILHSTKAQLPAMMSSKNQSDVKQPESTSSQKRQQQKTQKAISDGNKSTSTSESSHAHSHHHQVQRQIQATANSALQAKRQPCLFFVQGTCKHSAAECPFSHDITQMQLQQLQSRGVVSRSITLASLISQNAAQHQQRQHTSSTQEVNPVIQVKTRPQLCTFHINNRCNKGDRCPFSHDISAIPCRNYNGVVNFTELGGLIRQHGITMTLPPPPHQCPRGDSCQYSHIPLTNTQRIVEVLWACHQSILHTANIKKLPRQSITDDLRPYTMLLDTIQTQWDTEQLSHTRSSQTSISPPQDNSVISSKPARQEQSTHSLTEDILRLEQGPDSPSSLFMTSMGGLFGQTPPILPAQHIVQNTDTIIADSTPFNVQTEDAAAKSEVNLPLFNQPDFEDEFDWD